MTLEMDINYNLKEDRNGDDMEETVANNDMLSLDEESSDRDRKGNDE